MNFNHKYQQNRTTVFYRHRSIILSIHQARTISYKKGEKKQHTHTHTYTDCSKSYFRNEDRNKFHQVRCSRSNKRTLLDYDEEYLIYDSIHPLKNITVCAFRCTETMCMAQNVFESCVFFSVPKLVRCPEVMLNCCVYANIRV